MVDTGTRSLGAERIAAALKRPLPSELILCTCTTGCPIRDCFLKPRSFRRLSAAFVRPGLGVHHVVQVHFFQITRTSSFAFALLLSLSWAVPAHAQSKGDTARIQRSVVAGKSLSTYAHNVKIISQAGTVTLKGPVGSDDEVKSIVSKATGVTARADKVIDPMAIKPTARPGSDQNPQL